MIRTLRVHWLTLTSMALAVGPALAQRDDSRNDAVPATGTLTASNVLIPGSPSELDRLTSPPTNTDGYWLALRRAVDYGEIERAKQRLGELLDRPDLDPLKVLKLREKYGSALLIKLQANPQLREAAGKLFELANQGAEMRARDTARIEHFIGNLSKSVSEREYAIDQLRRSGPDAIPFFVKALRQPRADRFALRAGLMGLSSSVWPAVAAILESGDEDLMGLAIELLRDYAVPKSADSLWYVAAAPQYGPALRAHAADAIAYLTSTPRGELPSSVSMLGGIARRHYDHQAGLGRESADERIWSWQNGNVTSITEPISAAEEYYCLRAARQALELDPAYRPAKITLLSVALEKSVEKVGIDKALPNTRNGVLETALSAGPDLVADVLTDALRQRRTAVVLGAVRALAQTGGALLLSSNRSEAGLLVRALDYPDRRVQYAAATAILEIGPGANFPHSRRVVQSLVRALAPQSAPGVLIIDGAAAEGNRVGSLAAELGYLPEVARSGKAGFKAAVAEGSELLLIDADIQDWGLDDTLRNLRRDPRTSHVPIIVFADDNDRLDALKSLQGRYDHLLVLPSLATKDELATVLRIGFDDANNKPLAPAERSAQRREALHWLVRLARGENRSFDVRSAVPSLASLLSAQELGEEAAEALAHIPMAEAQSALANAVLDSQRSLPLRLAAAKALAKSIQRSGSALDNATNARLVALTDQADDDRLRLGVARLAGSIGPDGALVAKRLREYRPLTAEDLRPTPDADAKPLPAPEERPKEEAVETPKPEKPRAERAPREPATKRKPRPSFFDNP